MPILTILLTVLVICVVLWGTRALTTAFGVGEPISTVILVVVVILGLIMLLQLVGGPSLLKLS